MIIIQSIQTGTVRTAGDPAARDVLARQWTSAFDKRPVSGPVSVGELGIEGDAVADTKHHGGVDKAMLCYAAAHYRDWATEHPELAMGPGALGENLTLDGAVETEVCIGDVVDVGTCRVQVSQPRQPCWKIARRWGVKTLTKEVTQTGRTGWYVRVLRGGQLRYDDQWQLIDRPNPEWPISRANDVMFGRLADRLAVFELMKLPELAAAWRSDIG